MVKISQKVNQDKQSSSSGKKYTALYSITILSEDMLDEIIAKQGMTLHLKDGRAIWVPVVGAMKGSKDEILSDIESKVNLLASVS